MRACARACVFVCVCVCARSRKHDDVNQHVTLPFRNIAVLHCRTGGQGVSECSCDSNSSTKRCSCWKKKEKKKSNVPEAPVKTNGNLMT